MSRVVLAGVKDRHDVPVPELPGRSGFPQEPINGRRSLQDPRVRDLQGDLAIELRIVGAVDRAEGPGADLPVDPVTADLPGSLMLGPGALLGPPDEGGQFLRVGRSGATGGLGDLGRFGQGEPLPADHAPDRVAGEGRVEAVGTLALRIRAGDRDGHRDHPGAARDRETERVEASSAR